MASMWLADRQETASKNGPVFLSPRRIAESPVVLACYRWSPDALSSQASPVSVLIRSARSKHITSLHWLGEEGGRTLTSGQLQSSPAPFSQPGGEYLCQHAHTKCTPNQTEPYIQSRVGTRRDTWGAPGFWTILFTLGGNKRVAGFACVRVCVRQIALALAAKLPRQGADYQSFVC